MLFNQRIGDDEAALEEIVQVAAKRATAPNQASPGNASGVTGGFTNLIAAPPQGGTDPYPPIYPDEIGVDIDSDGNYRYWKPFHWGVDTFDDPYAYIPMGHPTKDYGN